MDALYTFWDNIARYKTESVFFWGLMNSATKVQGFGFRGEAETRQQQAQDRTSERLPPGSVGLSSGSSFLGGPKP